MERDLAARGVTSASSLRKGVMQTMVLAVILPGFHEGILKPIFIDTGITLAIRPATSVSSTNQGLTGSRISSGRAGANEVN